jgi:phenylpyruvate tautomerase PptA (4-oxalocrotonate tautomerase family)
MPLIRVELFDYRMSDETSAALIEKLTDVLCEATHTPACATTRG